MPTYRYLCMSPKGEYLCGEYTADDKRDLVAALWAQQFFLVWWEELDPEKWFTGPMLEIRPTLISQQEKVRLWQYMLSSANPPLIGLTVKNCGAAQSPTPSEPQRPPSSSGAGEAIVNWIAAHSRGAVQTRAQALSVFSFIALLTVGTVFNARLCLWPKPPRRRPAGPSHRLTKIPTIDPATFKADASPGERR